MLSPRIRRLKLDHDQLVQKFAGWPLIQITGTAGMPPEVYRFVYKIKGLFVSPAGEIQERQEHHLEVNLSLGYPRRAPQCRMLTPVFHPNFDDSTVCIGDFWAASEGLDDLVIRIGRMIAYQEYNTKSPLNGLAAKWAEQHVNLFPVESRDIAPPAEKTAVPAGNSPAAPPAPVEEAPMADRTPTAHAPDATAAASSDPWTQRISIE
ncbi:MAG TPA: ubiquitin-conjugating enzyme E2 [Tepidisphaeraceae bacterium]|jgi:ubiquitin-protein ligase|nr:ubiquitin-conjugating enzyme E2 [Tepidisphaeraceae bacterium]